MSRLHPRGFTLIEIIVVLLVFSVMAAMAYGGLNSVLKLRRGVEDSMQRTADLQRAFMRLRQDFQNVRDRPARDQFGDARAPLSFNRDEILTLVRGGMRNPMGSSRSSLERVSYRVKDHVLLRSTWPALDLPDKAEPTELALLKEVQELRWRFMDNGHEWQAEWPRSEAGQSSNPAAFPPPIAVEITLVTKDWGELRFLFRTPQAALAASGGFSTSSGRSMREGLLPASAADVGTSGRAVNQPDQPPTRDPSSDPIVEPPPDGPSDPGIPSNSD
ncbi:type II secretion system protein GspJ [Panacagrimonas perspica]|nr:type II secretion system protein GspJ [Panacagrimonas perspica]